MKIPPTVIRYITPYTTRLILKIHSMGYRLSQRLTIIEYHVYRELLFDPFFLHLISVKGLGLGFAIYIQRNK